MDQKPHRPTVVFVCVKNGGKSQMAAALLRHEAGDQIDVRSAGTRPGRAVNALSAEVIAEIGADMSGEHPRALDVELRRAADRLIVIGGEAEVEPVDGMRADIERWETDEPSTRGIEGIERMRLVRDDIARRVRALAAELTGEGADGPEPSAAP